MEQIVSFLGVFSINSDNKLVILKKVELFQKI